MPAYIFSALLLSLGLLNGHVMAAQIHEEHTPHQAASAYGDAIEGGEEAHDDDHDEHDNETEHAIRAEHDDHEEGLAILSAEQRRELAIEYAVATGGELHHELRLNGEIRLDAERTIHVIPALSGIVKTVHKKLGDVVQRGDALAVLDSRELADAKSEYLSALEQLTLAQDNHRRKAQLIEQQALPEQQLFAVQQELAEARIQARGAERKLHALGFSSNDITTLPNRDVQNFTEYTLRAPMPGTIVEKHITLGEVFNDESRADEARAFIISDLSALWVDFSVYPQDLSMLRVGQMLHVTSNDGLPATDVDIIHVSPLVDRETRTALVRARLNNPDGQFRAGLFVSGSVQTPTAKVDVLVPRSALVRGEQGMAVFVVEAEQYELRAVTIGHEARDSVEITTGLAAGETFVSQGGFILKAEQDKAAFAHAGHAH